MSSSQSHLEIEVNGQKLFAAPDQMIIAVCDAAGIYIPRFCYHKKLSIAANCRMCLVETSTSKKPVPACATPVTAGMQVLTDSAMSIDAQRTVMEFLLINHPLDCPICDQGGECELQDLAMGYGRSDSQYTASKRSVIDDDLGPLIATEMTRCIQCTRCVRFCDEIAGMRELGALHRGERMQISTYVNHAMKSELSGNIIDLCPVGALTARPSRFQARAWELQQAPSISVHDCIGTNINVHIRNRQVMRVIARENEAINSTWLADRDRFSYTALTHAERLAEPLVRVKGQWMSTSWEEAIPLAITRLCDVIKQAGDPDALGALISPNASVEECYLLQTLVRQFGSANIDHRLREIDTFDQNYRPTFPGLGMYPADFVQQDTVFLVGSNLRYEQPLAAMYLRQATRLGTKVLALNPIDYDFNFLINAKCIVPPHRFVESLVAIIQSLRARQNNPSFAENPLPVEIKTSTVSSTIKKHAKAIAEKLNSAKQGIIILGALAMHHPQATLLRYLAQQIASLTKLNVGFLSDGANSAGAWLAGALPHRSLGHQPVHREGLNAYQMFSKPRAAYLFVNVEPEYDCANAALAEAAMAKASCIVALSMYRNPLLEQYASVIFPMASFLESPGMYVNVAGKLQVVDAVIPPYQSSRPGRDILSALCESYCIETCTDLDNVPIHDLLQIQRALGKVIEKAMTDSKPTPPFPEVDFIQLMSELLRESLHVKAPILTRVGEIPIYAHDAILRHADALQLVQKTMYGELAALYLHPETAKRLQLDMSKYARVFQGNHDILLPIFLDERVAIDAAVIPGALSETMKLGDLIGVLTIQAA